VQIQRIASDEVTGGFSGAEVVAICREAALLAIEANDKDPTFESKISNELLMQAANGMNRQITPSMLDFFERFTNGIKR